VSEITLPVPPQWSHGMPSSRSPLPVHLGQMMSAAVGESGGGSALGFISGSIGLPLKDAACIAR
jgi:hypothetical protein